MMLGSISFGQGHKKETRLLADQSARHSDAVIQLERTTRLLAEQNANVIGRVTDLESTVAQHTKTLWVVLLNIVLITALIWMLKRSLP